MACQICKVVCLYPVQLECCDAFYCETCYARCKCQCDVKATPVFQRFLALELNVSNPYNDSRRILNLPDPTRQLNLVTMQITEMDDLKGFAKIYFDLETTDINPRTCRITQIGAVCEDKVFKTFVHADKPIHPDAEKITGIKDADLKDAPNCKDALLAFFAWVDECRERKPVVMCAHNGLGYDYILLLSEMHRWDLPGFATLSKHGIVRFVDTLPWARVNFPPHRLVKKPETNEPSFRLGDLYESVLGCRFDCAHDALADCRALKAFCESEYVTDKNMNMGCHDGHACYGIKEFISDFQKRKSAEDGDMLKMLDKNANQKGCKRTLLQFFNKDSTGKRQKSNGI